MTKKEKRPRRKKRVKKRTTLEKSLKPHWVWAIALGSAIGWGAFVQPVNWMSEAGPMGVIIGFTIGAILMMLIAVSYGFLIRSFPVSGGEFAYSFISMGRTHAFISAWFLTLGYLGIVALNASAFALMFKFVLPSIIEQLPMYTIAGWDVYGMEIIIATLVLVIFGFFNYRGTGLTGQIQFYFALVMVLTVVGVTFFTGIQPGTGLSQVAPAFPENKTALAAILSIVAIAPWAFVGFDAVPQAAEEFDFPARKAFMLIIFAILFAAIIYILMILATSMAAPWEETVAQNHLWGTAEVVQQSLGTAGLVFLVIALMMGIFTGLNGFIMATSRLLFSMSRARILPAPFRKLHPKHQTPHVAIIVTIALSAIAPWFGREALEWVVDMSSIGVSIAYFYTCLTAFKLFKWNQKDVYDPTKQEASPLKKSIAFIGMVASFIFVLLLLVPGSPAALGKESLITLVVWIILGILFYIVKQKEYNAMPEEELNFLILGSDEKIKGENDQ
ncbi:MAG TPA: APC family permease [Pseudogracilibacillus sp.]|nr:APC family permease [Pseudogracilibacillus sp.]